MLKHFGNGDCNLFIQSALLSQQDIKMLMEFISNPQINGRSHAFVTFSLLL